MGVTVGVMEGTPVCVLVLGGAAVCVLALALVAEGVTEATALRVLVPVAVLVGMGMGDVAVVRVAELVAVSWAGGRGRVWDTEGDAEGDGNTSGPQSAVAVQSTRMDPNAP